MFSNQLSPAETERLALLMEEMAEATHVIGKILRHGYDSSHPDGGPNNRQLLEQEAGHVLHAIDRMFSGSDIDSRGVELERAYKARHVGQYLHHQEGT